MRILKSSKINAGAKYNYKQVLDFADDSIRMLVCYRAISLLKISKDIFNYVYIDDKGSRISFQGKLPSGEVAEFAVYFMFKGGKFQYVVYVNGRPSILVDTPFDFSVKGLEKFDSSLVAKLAGYVLK